MALDDSPKNAFFENDSRKVIPEILDHLPPDSRDALRSRADLSRINFLMGNSRWIRKAVHAQSLGESSHIVEIGAGDGFVCNQLIADHPACRVTAYDLVPKPSHVHPDVQWLSADILETQAPPDGGLLIANLFLHHFEQPQLKLLGKWMRGFSGLVFNEPDRAPFPHFLGNLMHPFINHVTRHDMHVSIDAGFRSGEMAFLLGLDTGVWDITESSNWRGARRVIARKRV